MGASQSSAKSIVNECLSAGIDIVNKSMAIAESGNTQEVNIFLQDMVCTGDISIHDIKIKQLASLDTAAAAKLITSDDTQTAIKNAIRQKAESFAQAGLFLAESATEVVNNITTKLSTAIENE